AGLVSTCDQLFEHLPKHLGVNGDFHVQRRALRNREIEAVKEIIEDRGDAFIRYDDGGVLVVVVLFEQSTVEIRHLADEVFQKAAPVDADEIDFIGGVEPQEKEGLQPLVI